MGQGSTADLPLAMVSLGSGPPLLLFHGGMGSWRHWARNIEPLSRSFHVHALDLPGYGDSMAVKRGISSDEYFDLVERLLLQKFGTECPLHIAAFSFGARSAALDWASLMLPLPGASEAACLGADDGSVLSFHSSDPTML